MPWFFFTWPCSYLHNLCDATLSLVTNPITRQQDHRTESWLGFMKVILCNFKVWDINLRPQPCTCLAKIGNNFCKSEYPHPGLLVQFSHSVVSNSLQPHELQHARPPCPSPAPGVHPNPCPSSWCCHPAISSSVVPFSSCPQSLPAFTLKMPNCFQRGYGTLYQKV